MPERMSGKERMLCALGMGVPDRVPATIHQWLPYHLKYYMGGISDIDAFRQVGLDIASGGGVQEAGARGGYIISTCDHFFNTPVENIKAYAEAAKECVYTNGQ